MEIETFTPSFFVLRSCWALERAASTLLRTAKIVVSPTCAILIFACNICRIVLLDVVVWTFQLRAATLGNATSLYVIICASYILAK
jgi:hypothetical protein